MRDRVHLEVEIQRLEEEASYFRRHGNETGFNEKMTEANQLRMELDELTKDTIINGPRNPEESFSLESDGFTADFRALAAGEDEYQMLRVTTELYLARLLQAHAQELSQVKEVEKQKYAALDAELDQTRNDLQDVRGKLETAMNQITDIEIERDNALSEVESFKKQVEELKSQGTKPSVPTNLDGASSLAEINARIEAKKIPVFNVRPGDYKTSFYLAQLAESGEEIEIRPYYDLKSKYREVSAEEAQRFQSEREAAKADIPEAEEPVSSDMELTIEVPTFRKEVPNEDAGSELAGDAVTPESVSHNDGGEVTREEFESLKHEVTMLAVELKARSILPHNWEAVA